MEKLLNNDKKYTILVAPLDWGLGHATRCIPIISHLLRLGHQVIIGSDGAQAALLNEHFPELKIVTLKGYQIQYSADSRFFAFKIGTQIPKILRSIAYENQWLKQIVKEHQIDVVISDNRYGLNNEAIPCIFITHQLTIKAPFKWLEYLLRKINYSYINRFTECWVPDMEGAENIAGELSHPFQMPTTAVHYINLLSRFTPIETVKKFEYCILLSGPEPQRTVFENIVIESIKKIKGSILLVRGKPLEKSIPFIADHITVYNHLNAIELSKVIQESEYIICRSGYSTLMDLLILKKKMIVVPTPGQTEQEYLANKLSKEGIVLSANQQNIDLAHLFDQAKSLAFKKTSFKVFDENSLANLIKKIES
ncbi:MAG: glycosyltransferase [Sphingobacteriia bacterium]|jgi:uncharacterized protein (TIGR00661 family)